MLVCVCVGVLFGRRRVVGSFTGQSFGRSLLLLFTISLAVTVTVTVTSDSDGAYVTSGGGTKYEVVGRDTTV